MDKTSNSAYHKIDQENYLQTFRRYPLALKTGKGARVWDVEGKAYIDALAGIAVNSVGHCHPKVVEAISKQASELIHISNFYVSEPQVMLSKKLTEVSGLERVFFSNSGAESVEGAIKIARKYAHSVGRGGEVISFEGSFHGRTLATIATGKEKMQTGFGPIPQGFKRVPFNDIEAVMAATTQETGAIIVEPIQGEGGINPSHPCFLRALREFCTRNDIVLIFDEVQTGVGRTGEMFGKDLYHVQPDIMPLAKALGGGVPIGAILSNEKVSSAIEFGDHGTTFGGNPLVCATSLAVLEVIEEENLLKKAKEKEAYLRQLVEDMNEPSIKQVRGRGLMIGIVFDFETKPLVAKMLEHGVLANATAGNVLRLVPPLTITKEEIKEVIMVLEACLKEIKTHA